VGVVINTNIRGIRFQKWMGFAFSLKIGKYMRFQS
jgi:hypothetical protein